MLRISKAPEIQETIELLRIDLEDVKRSAEPERQIGRLRGDLTLLAILLEDAGCAGRMRELVPFPF